jgi:hypothetical protein
MASRAARAAREMPDIEVLDPEEEIGGRR